MMKMKKKEIEDLLMSHADALNAGRAREWLKRQTTPISAEAKSLFELVHRAHGGLRRVTPRPDFVADLKARLQAAAKADPQITIRRQRQPVWLWIMAGIGGLVSAVSVVFILGRVGGTLFRKVPASQVATAKVPVSH
jgi:hypothetical protein